MATKMGPSKAFKAIDVEVEEIVEEIMEDGGLPTEEVDAIHYYVEYERSDLQRESVAIEALQNYIQFLKVRQETTKRSKVSFKPILDYTQSQVLTIGLHIEALEDIVEMKFRVAQEEKEKIKQKKLTKMEKVYVNQKKEKVYVNQKKEKDKALVRVAKDKEIKERDLERKIKQENKEIREVAISYR